MAHRLTDRQKKEIMADYAESNSYRATAIKFGVSDMTVKRICEKNVKLLEKVEQKKEQNTADMIAFMDSRKEKAQSVIDTILEEMGKPETIANAKLSEMATAFGIVIDKFVTNPQKHALDRQKLETELAKLESQLKETAPEETADDNFMEAMNGYSEDVWGGEEEWAEKT